MELLLNAFLDDISLKYHRLHPEYIHTRIEKLAHLYTLRVLLILSDIVSQTMFITYSSVFILASSLNTKIQYVNSLK